MKKVLLLPGFGENIDTSEHERNYPRLIRAIEELGYELEFVEIDWKYKTHEHYAQQLKEVYDQHKPEQTVLAGFSFGATTALLVAAERAPSELWLFSLSPYFAEVIDDIPEGWKKYSGKRRIEYLANTSVVDLLDSTTCPVKCWFGKEEIEMYFDKIHFMTILEDHESVSLIERIPCVGHDATDRRYIDSITKHI